MLNIIKNLLKKKKIKLIDFYYAKNISKKNDPLILIISIYISFQLRKGNTYVSLKKIFKDMFFSKKILKKIKIKYNLKKIKNYLLKSDSIGKKNTNYPLIIEKNYLFLNKIWNIEKNIYNFLNKKYELKKYKYSKWKKILNKNFFKKLNTEQKNAIILCLLNKFTFIIGKPGTGKTTIISIIIYFFLKLSKNKKIILTAPTGKASAILLESIKKNKLLLKINKNFKKYIPNSSFTIHDFFKINLYNENNIFYKKKKVQANILIIDESSMIDIFMFDKIINLIYKNTQVIFIGDNYQLPSINIGSILNDIYIFFLKNKNINLYLNFKECIKNKKFNQKFYKKNIFLKNKICILNKQYRYKKKSDIDICSKIIKKFKKNKIKKIINNKYKNFKFFIIKNKKKIYLKITKKIFLLYKNYFKMVINKQSIKKILEEFNRIRILCILKKGWYGVKGINKIFKFFIKKKKITYFKKINKKEWYIGKPIIIKKNLKNIKLFNGSIGITLLDKKNEMKIFFLMPNNSIKIIPINIIKKYKTTWAITVHKSQGSEFNHIILILPLKKNKIMSREIIYTAITRAKKYVWIYSKKNIFIKYIKNRIIKKSGLIKKLKNIKY
ncbi:MAG: exodeoxyribonuclease V subunit alpha [Buchnera aphidicola (Periphyllus acericola)]|nr:exodeoxyribonuclease V subunit alpha [Buchnera aphidicola (Periphyllus acericola)]